jgi:hypothetical protein
LTAVYSPMPTGEPAVRLSWLPATDENGGEKDVERYVIWRKAPADPDWNDPYLSIPAGTPTYVWLDASVTSGDQFFYALAAQDCTPTLSNLATSVLVVIP